MKLINSRLLKRAILTIVFVAIPSLALAGSVLVPPATVSGNTTAPSFQATNTGAGKAISATSNSIPNATLTAINMATTGGSAITGNSTGNAIQGTSKHANG